MTIYPLVLRTLRLFLGFAQSLQYSHGTSKQPMVLGKSVPLTYYPARKQPVRSSVN